MLFQEKKKVAKKKLRYQKGRKNTSDYGRKVRQSGILYFLFQEKKKVAKKKLRRGKGRKFISDYGRKVR